MFERIRRADDGTSNDLGDRPGLANTGWGVVRQHGPRMECVAYGCVSTPAGVELSQRLAKIHEQISAVISRFDPVCLGIETVWFGQNITAAFATGQARGAALVACAQHGLSVGEFTPAADQDGRGGHWLGR